MVNLDPTECLADIKRILATTQWLPDDAGEELANAVENLCEWIEAGGFLPQQWSEARARHGLMDATAPTLLPAAHDAPAGAEIIAECTELATMLLEKNRKYGNSVLKPVRVFSRAAPTEQLLVRLDDKLARLRSAQPDDAEDTVLDLLGYLIMLRIARKQERAAGTP